MFVKLLESVMNSFMLNKGKAFPWQPALVKG